LNVRPPNRWLALAPVALLVAAAAPAAAADGAPADGTTADGTTATPERMIPPLPTDSLPGSSAPPGLGMAPEAPPVPPAAGGRAPSFGAPITERPTSFRLNGRFFGWEAIGIGQKASNPPPGSSGTALHTPLLSVGKIPFWGGAGFTLNTSYGTRYVTAVGSYYFRLKGAEYNGYVNPQMGPSFGTAFLLLTPEPLGALRLTLRVGAFVEVYAGPGQWGWGIFGPLLGLRGYGETTNADWDATRDLHLTFTGGFLAVPGVPENFARGDYNSYIETGISDYVMHAHVAATVRGQYIFRLHWAASRGNDERVVLPNLLGTPHEDGRWNTYLGEARYQGDPWGQIGFTGGVYNFQNAASVGDGTWWAVDWTQGAREMINKFLGPNSGGNGNVAVAGAEWNFSVSRILWAPRSFNGDAPDLRVAIAAMVTRTLSTGDPNYKNATGYYTGIETEYRMTSLFSLTLQAYGESRPSYIGEYSVYSINPGIAFHTDWYSLDRIQLIYGRRFYSRAADPNTAEPLDRHMIALGGYVTF